MKQLLTFSVKSGVRYCNIQHFKKLAFLALLGGGSCGCGGTGGGGDCGSSTSSSCGGGVCGGGGVAGFLAGVGDTTLMAGDTAIFLLRCAIQRVV